MLTNSVFLRVYGSRDGVEVHYLAKKNKVNIAVLTEQVWSITDLSHCVSGNVF